MAASRDHKNPLEPPAGSGRRRSTWRDSLSKAFAGRGGGGSGHPSEPEGSEPSPASALSRFSLTTLFGITGVSPCERQKGEKARSLLTHLLKSQKSPESSGAELSTDIHNLVPCGDVVGLLAVSVKQLKDFTPKFNVKQDTNLLIRISIDKIMKCTNPQIYRANQKPSKKSIAINFGDVRYFSVKVPNQQSDARNRIVLELVGFEGPRDLPRLFGALTVHLYEVIQKQSFTKIYSMRIRNLIFCMVEVEFMFCYGSLGYGYSHQLKLPGADPAKAVACSMFMRVPPPKDRKDTASNVIKPQLMDYPAVLSSDLNVTVGNLELEVPTKNYDYEMLQRALKEPPRERLVQMKQEYRNLKTWHEKADYLDQLILKKGPKTKPGLVKIIKRFGVRYHQYVDDIHDIQRSQPVLEGVAHAFKEQVYRFGVLLDSGLQLEAQVSSVMSRFRQVVEKVQSSSKESTFSAGPETVLHEEKQPEFMVNILESECEIPVIESSQFEMPGELREGQTDSDTDSEKDRDRLTSADTSHSVPAMTLTSSFSAASAVPLDITDSLARKITRIEFPRESETSLSSSSGIPAEFYDSHADSESTVFEGLESKAVDEEPAPPAKKESSQSVQESPLELEVPDVIEAPKPSESFSEPLQQWPWKEIEFQEAVFSGNKFEPFLRNIRGVQAPVLTKGKTDETSIFSYLEKMRPYEEIKEQEDQDPPPQMSPRKDVSSADTKLVKSGEQLSILRLIEKNINLEEEEPQVTTEKEEEPKPPAIKSEKQVGKELAESEIQQVQISFKRSVEDFLVNRLMKVIALKSLLSENVENLVEEQLLKDEVSEELEDGMSAENLPDDKRKNLLVGRKPCSAKRLSELDIKNLKAAASQNLQASLIGKLSAHGIIPGMEAAENNQEVSISSSAEEDFLKRKKHLSKERISQTDIITLKSLSDSQSEDSSKTESKHSSQGTLASRDTSLPESKTNDEESALHHKSQGSSVEGTNTEMDLDEEHPRKSLEIIRVRLPTSTETELTKKSLDKIKFSEAEAGPKSDSNKTVHDTLIEKLLKAEIASLKSFLSKGLQDHLKDKLSETGLSTKEDFEKMCQKLSLNAKDELKMALEKALPEGGLISSEDNRSEICATKVKPEFSESIQNFVLETLSESETANLKSVLDKKIQDHLLERLSEIGLITEEELRKVLGNFFPVVGKETPPKGVNEKVFKREGVAHSTSSLTQSLQDRFSEEELNNLKSLLNRLLKQDQKDKLSESEIKGLSSVLQKNFKDLPVQSSSETGISKEVEIKDECHTVSLLNTEESSPGGTTVEVSEKEKCPSKDSLSKTFSNADPGLGETPDLPVNSVFEEDTMNKKTQTNNLMPPHKKLVIKAEKPDPSINSVLDAEATYNDTQTTGSVLPPKKVKKSYKKESHRLQSSDKPDTPNSKRTSETLLKNKPADELLKQIPESFTASSFLSAHDIGIQTELKNFLSRPPSYFSKPTFPVNPQTFLFLHSESEEEAKLPSKLNQKAKSKKKPDKSAKKDTFPHHLQQVGMNPQLKKEKTTGASMSKEVLKEKGRRHCEPLSPKLSIADSKKDIKASPSVLRKEKQKSEKKRDEAKPKRSFTKTAVLADPSPQNLGKTLPDKLSVTKFPASWRTKGNTPSIPGTFDLDMETFKHLEKAIERALIDLGKAPEGSPGQAPQSAKASTAPGIATTANELLRSLATNPSAVENPGNSASSLSEMLDNQEQTVKISPELLEVVLWILQNTLRQNTRSQSNG